MRPGGDPDTSDYSNCANTRGQDWVSGCTKVHTQRPQILRSEAALQQVGSEKQGPQGVILVLIVFIY
jgi:hypothetical protein